MVGNVMFPWDGAGTPTQMGFPDQRLSLSALLPIPDSDI